MVDTNAPTSSYRDEFLNWFPEFDGHRLVWIDADPALAWKNNCARERHVNRETFDHVVSMFEPPSAGEGAAVSRAFWSTICRIRNVDNEFQPPEFIKGEPWDCSL